MKALSLTQPWASLVAVGAKRIETRSWGTRYRGSIAIHASKGFPKWARKTCEDEPFRSELLKVGAQFRTPPTEHWYHAPSYHYVGGLPLGAIVAVATLAHAVSTAWLDTDPGRRLMAELGLELTKNEEAFGDYAEGRWAWLLTNVRRLPEPVSCCGALGLWDVPAGHAARLEAL